MLRRGSLAFLKVATQQVRITEQRLSPQAALFQSLSAAPLTDLRAWDSTFNTAAGFASSTDSSQR